jgi:ribosome-binding factor A
MRTRSIFYIKDSVTNNFFISGTVMSQDINDARIYLKEKGAKKAQKEIGESFEQVDNASTKSKTWEDILRSRRHLPFYGAIIVEVVIEDRENSDNKQSN